MAKAFVIIAALVTMAFCIYDFTRPVETVVVTKVARSGDTLWGLVVDAMKETGDKRTIDEVVYYTAEANKLKAANLPVGAVIAIPCKVKK